MRQFIMKAMMGGITAWATPSVWAEETSTGMDTAVSDARSEETAAAAVTAWCAGGPYVPAYAYYRYETAQECARYIAREGRDCRHQVRVGRCAVRHPGYIGDIRPYSCQCAPGFRPVGRWL